METQEEVLRIAIIDALIKAIKDQDRNMIEALAWVSHPVALQRSVK